MPSDIKEVVFALGIQILLMGRKAENANEAAKMMTEEIESLRAYNRFCTFVAMQGGDVSQLEDTSRLPKSAIEKHIFAQESGYVSACDCGLVGRAALAAGAGREKKESDIDYGAGIYLEKTYGDAVQKGKSLAVVYASTEAKAEEAATLLQKSFRISKQEPPKRKMIKEILN
jgi:pyrimidine-nucleoside phosphorylase